MHGSSSSWGRLQQLAIRGTPGNALLVRVQAKLDAQAPALVAASCAWLCAAGAHAGADSLLSQQLTTLLAALAGEARGCAALIASGELLQALVRIPPRGPAALAALRRCAGGRARSGGRGLRECWCAGRAGSGVYAQCPRQLDGRPVQPRRSSASGGALAASGPPDAGAAYGAGHGNDDCCNA